MSAGMSSAATIAWRRPSPLGYLKPIVWWWMGPSIKSGLSRCNFPNAKKATPIYLADYRDFDRFIDTLTAVKKHHNIKNSALALRSLCDLAMRALEDEIREGEKA